mmetsp:Transcript_48150/g.35343  ORF Transcript_48150/g.35343 Transcript_48150/m.35343 type:complete len:620 (+) Transcript_48150:69-1928(+)
MTSIKVSYGTEIRRITLSEEEARGLSSFSGFAEKVKSLFPQLKSKSISLAWYDNDGDKITVSSDAEYREAVRFMKPTAEGKILLRFEIEPTSYNVVVVVHGGVTCDECGMFPIRGIRYKCTVRDDYDLCESCMSKNTQPHAMLAISHPTQAPEGMFYAFREHPEEARGHCPWRRGGCRRGFGAAPHTSAQPSAPCAAPAAASTNTENPPTNVPSNGGNTTNDVPRWKARWARRQERCGRHVNEAVAPFIAAFDKMMQAPTSSEPVDVNKVLTGAFEGLKGAVAAAFTEEDKDRATNSSDAQQALEEQLMQEALQESILLHEVATAFAEKDGTESSQSTSSAAATPIVASPPVPPAPLQKPALRFIKDVTYPDGSVVQPGDEFVKVWRVRNDGPTAWPEGVILVAAGGDSMLFGESQEKLPALAAGEEGEISLELTAPSKSGLFTAYFRAQTKDKQFFGHRLWSTVMVAEPPVATSASPESSSVVSAVAAPSPMSALVMSEEDWVDAQQTSGVAESGISSSNFNSSVSVLPSTAFVAPVGITATAASSMSSPSSSSSINPLQLLWRKELAVLADMGFIDADVNLPLLQQHLVTPVALRGDPNAVPSTEGMQRIIGALLGM